MIDVHLTESNQRELVNKVEAHSSPAEILNGVNFSNNQAATNSLSPSLQADGTNFLERKAPQKRPINKVMKMIGAFERGLTQVSPKCHFKILSKVRALNSPFLAIW